MLSYDLRSTYRTSHRRYRHQIGLWGQNSLCYKDFKKGAYDISYTLNLFSPLLLDENCQFLLELADEYQMERVKELCCEYLSCNVHDTNCVKFYMIAERFGLDTLLKETLQESKYLPLSSLEKDEIFKELPDKTKLEICKARIQELEKTLAEYVSTCSSLVSGMYKRVAEKVQITECDNYEVHRCGVNERFKLSCKCCRRRVQYANCELEYWDFRTQLKKLFDLEHCNRTARQCKSSAATS